MGTVFEASIGTSQTYKKKALRILPPATATAELPYNLSFHGLKTQSLSGKEAILSRLAQREAKPESASATNQQ